MPILDGDAQDVKNSYITRPPAVYKIAVVAFRTSTLSFALP